jgi:hypothetical protein
MRYFLDTEFNGMGGDLISLALVSENSRELYLAAPCLNPVPWVAANVMPIVRCAGASPIMDNPALLGTSIAYFLQRDSKPYVIADWPDDIAYFCKTLIVGPGQMVKIPSLAFEIIRVDAYPTDLSGAIQHNALWDARALRHKIIGQSPASAA